MFTAAASAIALLFARSVFKGALWFLICLLSIAGLFVLSYAEFVAVTQILIYAGGVLVVILFGIMFTSKLAAKPLRVENTNVIGGIVAGTLIFGLLTKLVLENTVVTEIASSPRAIESIGLSLMTDYALPFEVIGLLLLITLIGASVVTAFMKEKKQ
ncbi:MAG TPA: NADH-quinone oxidoreductase subunit J [Chryseosolibacter sp.]